MLTSNTAEDQLAPRPHAYLTPWTMMAIVMLLASGCAGGQTTSSGFFDLVPNKQFSAVEQDAVSQATSRKSTTNRVAQVSYGQPTGVSKLGAGEHLMDRIRQADGNVLIDFYADWCGPCRTQAKLLQQMTETAAQNSITIIKVDIDAHQDLATKFDVKSLPTLLRVRDGKVVERQTGLAKQAKLEKMLQ